MTLDPQRDLAQIDGERVPFNDRRWSVRDDAGTPVGNITSALYSPRLERNIGYAWVPVALSEIGAELTVQTPFREAADRVVPKPFVDPSKEIPKS